MTPDLLPERLPDHIDRLYRAAWALCGRREDAEDLVQETFARVLAKRRVIRSDVDALPYLLRALRNTFMSSKRGVAARQGTVPLEVAASELTSGADTSPSARAETREVFTHISALPDDYRDVIVAVDVVGLTYSEAASALSIPEGTVMSRLYRGRARVARAVAA